MLFNQTPLHYSSENDKQNSTEYLVNNKADINAQDNDVMVMNF